MLRTRVVEVRTDSVKIDLVMIKVDTTQPWYDINFVGYPLEHRYRLLVAMREGKCVENMCPHPGDGRFPCHVMVDNSNVQLVFVWCWPSERFTDERTQISMIGPSTMVAIVCYDRSLASAFQTARTQLDRIRNSSRCRDVPVLLVDCEMDKDQERCVSEDEGRALAGEFSCVFFQVSVLTGDGIPELLVETAIQAKNRRCVMEERRAKEAEQRALEKQPVKSCTVQ